MALKDELTALSVDEQAWSSYLATRHLALPADSSIVFVAVENDSRVSDEMISRRITQTLGEPLDRDKLLQDIAAIYALGYWDLIDFEVKRTGEGAGLVIKAKGKAWGGNKLKFGMNLISDLDGVSDFNLGTSYSLKGVNSLGGEVYARAQIGDTLLLSGEFYQPLDLDSRFFVVPYLGWQDRKVLTIGPAFDTTHRIIDSATSRNNYNWCLPTSRLQLLEYIKTSDGRQA